MAWQMGETGITEAGDVGGDIQVGEAYEASFVNPDLPRCVVQVTVFVSARELAIEDQPLPECTHTEPEGWKCLHGWDELHKPDPGLSSRCLCWIPDEHLWCGYDMDSLGLETYTEYVITRENMADDEGPWDSPDWEEISSYEDIETQPFEGDVKAANKAARNWLIRFNPACITWDGEPFHGRL